MRTLVFLALLTSIGGTLFGAESHHADVFLAREHLAEHALSDFCLKHVPALADLHLLGFLAVGFHIVLAHSVHKLSEQAADRRLFIDVRIRETC